MNRIKISNYSFSKQYAATQLILNSYGGGIGLIGIGRKKGTKIKIKLEYLQNYVFC